MGCQVNLSPGAALRGACANDFQRQSFNHPGCGADREDLRAAAKGSGRRLPPGDARPQAWTLGPQLRAVSPTSRQGERWAGIAPGLWTPIQVSVTTSSVTDGTRVPACSSTLGPQFPRLSAGSRQPRRSCVETKVTRPPAALPGTVPHGRLGPPRRAHRPASAPGAAPNALRPPGLRPLTGRHGDPEPRSPPHRGSAGPRRPRQRHHDAGVRRGPDQRGAKAGGADADPAAHATKPPTAASGSPAPRRTTRWAYPRP